MHPTDMRVDPESASAVLKQFAALGYIAPTEDQNKAVASSLREAKYNLARVYMDKGQPRLALPMFEDLYKEQPDQSRFAQHLAQCYFTLRRIPDAKRVLTELMNRPPPPPEKEEKTAGEKPDAEGSKAKIEGAEAQPENQAAAAAAKADEKPPDADQGQQTKGNEQAATEKQPSAAANGRPRPWMDWMMGVILFQERKMKEALEAFLRAEQANPRMPDLHVRLGETYLRLRRVRDAERAYRKALEIDGDSPEAHLGLARAMLRRQRNGEAVEEALVAVSLQHFLPMGHFYLGVALARLGHVHRATLAFETAAAMVPGMVAAHRWLVALNRRPGGDRAKALEHQKLLQGMVKRRQAAIKRRRAAVKQ